MRFYPTKIHRSFLCFVLASMVLNFGCSKDSDLLVDSVLNDDSISSVEERDSTSTDEGTTEEQASEEGETTPEGTETQQDNLESRTTSFSPSNDAYFQSGKGYNQNIIRLEENSRTSYLMFDLNPIAEIEGTITSAHLQFTINGDDGSGTILVHKGNSSDWTEDSLSETTVPEIESQLGEIIKEYKIGVTEIVELDAEAMSPNVATLILEHKNGNDLAFASKEHVSKIGPKLVITYDVVPNAQEIEIIEEPVQEEEAEETAENKEPMAVADATPTSGKLPLEVMFVGSNSSDDQEISTFSWDFKDGSTSDSADPTHTFTEIGTFEVLLTVTDTDGLAGSDTVIITVGEEENQAPTAKVSATPITGEAPLEVTFTGSDSSDDNAITKYDWNFKDGSRTNIADFTYTYTTAGVYEAELTVTDENGLTDSETITITVTEPENEAPKANVTANPTSGNAPLNVQFTGNTSTDDNAITSYFWDFKDGTSATNQNPSHSFANPGVYAVELTVKDAQGLSDTKTVNITVNEASGGNDGGNDGGSDGGNAPPGYYVATNGNSFNNGQSASSPWSLEHAFDVAKPGDIIYIKAGNYGNKQIVNYQSGTSSNPIKFIGYTNTPGDLISNQGSTFSHGESLNSGKMPLLSGSSGSQGVGIDLNGNYIEVHNFQITNYKVGLFTKGRQVLLKNVIITNTGNQASNSTQEGRGFQVYGDYTTIENCFVLNSNSEGINLKGANNCKVRYTSVYSDNKTNPTGYYILISSGASNNTIENCKIYRDKNADLHRGHGYVLKDLATNNTVRNSTAYNTGIEVNFSGVAYNNFQNVNIYGSFSSDNGEFSSSIRVLNGAHHNTFTNINIENSRYAVGFIDLNDGFVGSGGDRDKNEGGHDNKFIGIKSKNTKNIVGVTSDVVGAAAFSNNNEFRNCTFDDVSAVPFYSYQDVNNTKFISCSFKNIPNSTLVTLFNGGSFPISFQSCSFSNIGFPQP